MKPRLTVRAVQVGVTRGVHRLSRFAEFSINLPVFCTSKRFDDKADDLQRKSEIDVVQRIARKMIEIFRTSLVPKRT